MAREKLFKNLKLQEKYSMFLIETHNAVVVDSRTGKYNVLKTIDTKAECFWFLGKSGAVRINRKNYATTSFDFQRQIQPKFDVWEKTKSQEN